MLLPAGQFQIDAQEAVVTEGGHVESLPGTDEKRQVTDRLIDFSGLASSEVGWRFDGLVDRHSKGRNRFCFLPALAAGSLEPNLDIARSRN